MRVKDYIPDTEIQFYKWVNYIFPYVTDKDNIARWKLPPDAVTSELTYAFNDFNVKYLYAKNPETRTPAAITAKTNSLKGFKSLLRKYIKGYITYNTLVNNEDRRIMNLPIHDTKPTPASPPTEEPIFDIGFRRQEHDIIVKNKDGKKNKPKNANGFEIWRKVGGNPPQTDTDFSYTATSTRSIFTMKYGLSESGKNVWYRVRWVNSKNEPGPWSDISNAIIP
jgi:hypothetical protein